MSVELFMNLMIQEHEQGVAENGGFDAGGFRDYADAVAGKIGAVLFAGCVARVEGEGKDEQTECCEKSASPSRVTILSAAVLEPAENAKQERGPCCRGCD